MVARREDFGGKKKISERDEEGKTFNYKTSDLQG